MTKKIIAFLLFSTVYLVSPAQQLLDSLVNISGTKYPQEKIYLQFDKSYYSSGETIWFKAYVTAAGSPSTISKTLYAELVNTSGTVLQRKTVPVLQGGAASFFELADSNYTSKLIVRAYTSWMLNFEESLLYQKPINIINTKNVAAQQPKSSFTLTFFPEGGDLVENTHSRVAFKTNNENGIPFEVSGTVTDMKGVKTGNFTSVHDGMGYFDITPLPGIQYKAIWKDKNGLQHETGLPVANVSHTRYVYGQRYASGKRK